MASAPSTHAQGCFIQLGKQVIAGSGNLILVLFKSVGAATDTTLRNCQSLTALLAAGAVRCDFTGYADWVMTGADFTVTYQTTTPFKAILTPAAKVWNPAGGATNNSPVKSALLHRASGGDPESAWFPLGICDASGTAGGGSYTYTFGPLTSQST